MSNKNNYEYPKILKAADPALQQHIEHFRETVTKNAMIALTVTIPQKLKEMNDRAPIDTPILGLLSDTGFNRDHDIYKVPNVEIKGAMPAFAPSGIPNAKRIATDSVTEATAVKLPKYIYTASLGTNVALCQRLDVLKKDTTELLEIIAAVKLWIQLNIPKIEDGNNFGVAIQEDVIQELSRVEEAALSMRDNSSKFHIQRGKLLTKILKYPNVEDYRITLRELDEKQWFATKIAEMDTRNNYCFVMDMLYKNWTKVVRPRNTEGSGNMMVY